MQNSYHIHACGIEDLAKIQRISEETFRETFASENTEEDMQQYVKMNFSEEVLRQELENPASVYFLAEKEGVPAAYLKVNFEEAQTEKGHPQSLEIQRIYVLRTHKAVGLGRALILEAEALAKKTTLAYLWLGVWEHNHPAIQFYEKLGFRIFDSHIFMLGDDPQKDYLMKREL